MGFSVPRLAETPCTQRHSCFLGVNPLGQTVCSDPGNKVSGSWSVICHLRACSPCPFCPEVMLWREAPKSDFASLGSWFLSLSSATCSRKRSLTVAPWCLFVHPSAPSQEPRGQDFPASAQGRHLVCCTGHQERSVSSPKAVSSPSGAPALPSQH